VAIALDNGSASRGLAFGTDTLTHAFTVGSGTDRYLFVSAGCDSGHTVTSVTYAGVSMALVDFKVSSSNYLSQWALANPASGSNNVVVTTNASATVIACNEISFDGVEQTGQPEASNTAITSSGSTLGNAVTTLTDNAWVVISAQSDSQDVTASTNVTATSSNNPLTGYYGPKTPAGSITLTVANGLGDITSIVAAIAPAGAAPSVTFPGYISPFGWN
jgi:hypothetical protein